MVSNEVLIYRQGSIGDSVVSLPAFKYIRKTNPNAKIVLLTARSGKFKASATEDVMKGMGLIDEVISYREGARNPVEIFRLAKKIRNRRFPICYYLVERSRWVDFLRDAFFIYSTGISHLSPKLWKRDLRLPRLSGGIYENEVKRIYRTLAGSLSPSLDALDMKLTEDEHEAAKRYLDYHRIESFVTFAPFSKRSANEWSEVRWRTLLSKLQQHNALPYVVIGAESDFDLAENILGSTDIKYVNACGALPVRVSAALIGLSELFVGVDSGPMHLADSTSVPVVCLFSARDIPGRWYPYSENSIVLQGVAPCSGCLIEQTCEYGNQCMNSISVDMVFKACQSALSART